MKITSLDVHRKEFGHAVRGYREDEVDDFLDAIAIELDRLQAQIEDLATHAQQSESAALNFEAEKNTINNALLTAQRASDEVLAQAKEKSKKLLEEADLRAEKTLLSARKEKDDILEDIKHLKIAEEKFRAGVLAHAEETINQLREVGMPRVPVRKEIPIPMIDTTEAADDLEEVSLDELEEVSAESIMTAPDLSPQPVAAAVPPVSPFKKEEGIGQFGEMEDDLETID